MIFYIEAIYKLSDLDHYSKITFNSNYLVAIDYLIITDPTF